jgi:hypothetical protein
MSYRRTTEFRMHLRVVEESDTPFTEDEHPSLPGMTVYDTTGSEVVTETRGPSLAKCGAVASERRRAGSRK